MMENRLEEVRRELAAHLAFQIAFAKTAKSDDERSRIVVQSINPILKLVDFIGGDDSGCVYCEQCSKNIGMDEEYQSYGDVDFCKEHAHPEGPPLAVMYSKKEADGNIQEARDWLANWYSQ